MTAGSSSGSASSSSSSSSSSSLGSRGGIVLPVTRLQSTNHVEKFSGMHGVMSAPVRERMLARALARATNFARDMATHCDKHVVSVVTLGCDKSQASRERTTLVASVVPYDAVWGDAWIAASDVSNAKANAKQTLAMLRRTRHRNSVVGQFK
jgi:hypothetical protein